jgi:hypothetical protein
MRDAVARLIGTTAKAWNMTHEPDDDDKDLGR